MTTAPSISSLSFLIPGSFTDEDPASGLEATLALFEYAEELGFQGAWIRQQHAVTNISSAAVFLGAASQRTRHVELGTAVIQAGYEGVWRLAEDLATADVLSGGRLQVGLSAGVPPTAELLGGLVFDGDWRSYDLSHERILRLAGHLAGDYLGDEQTRVNHPAGPQRPRLRPHDPGLAQRLWYGAASMTSVRWAAEHGLNLVLANICSGRGIPTDKFAEAQVAEIDAYRASFAGPREPRIVAGRVIVPTDSADAATRRKYRDYEASRHERTLAPQGGERRALFAPDLVGTSAEIVEALHADVAIGQVSELQLELPYAFTADEYRQILADVTTSVAPELGWKPRA